MIVFYAWKQTWCSNRDPFIITRVLPLLRHVVPLIYDNFRLTVPVGTRDSLTEITKIWILKCGKIKSAAMSPVYDEYANFI